MVHKIESVPTPLQPPRRPRNPSALRPDEIAAAVAFTYSKDTIAEAGAVVTRARAAITTGDVWNAVSAVGDVVKLLHGAMLKGLSDHAPDSARPPLIARAISIPAVRDCVQEIFGGAERPLSDRKAIAAIERRPNGVAEFTAALLWARIVAEFDELQEDPATFIGKESLKILQFRQIAFERSSNNTRRARSAIAAMDEEIAEQRDFKYDVAYSNPLSRGVIDEQKTGEEATPDSVDDLVARLEKLVADNPTTPVSEFAREKLLGLTRIATEQARGRQPNNLPLPVKAPALWEKDRFPTDTPVTFIVRNYKPWLGRGLVRGDIRKYDAKLYEALYNFLKRHPLPAECLLPTHREQGDAAIRRAFEQATVDVGVATTDQAPSPDLRRAANALRYRADRTRTK